MTDRFARVVHGWYRQMALTFRQRLRAAVEAELEVLEGFALTNAYKQHTKLQHFRLHTKALEIRRFMNGSWVIHWFYLLSGREASFSQPTRLRDVRDFKSPMPAGNFGSTGLIKPFGLHGWFTNGSKAVQQFTSPSGNDLSCRHSHKLRSLRAVQLPMPANVNVRLINFRMHTESFGEQGGTYLLVTIPAYGS